MAELIYPSTFPLIPGPSGDTAIRPSKTERMMQKILASLLLAGATLTAGCAMEAPSDLQTVPPPPVDGAFGSELIDARLHVVEVDGNQPVPGGESVVHMMRDGTAHATIPATGETVQGRWWIRNDAHLCFRQPVRGDECWPYTQAFGLDGDTIRITSDRGRTADVTLLSVPPA